MMSLIRTIFCWFRTVPTSQQNCVPQWENVLNVGLPVSDMLIVPEWRSDDLLPAGLHS
jgi:hypothetical protein